MLVHSDIKLFSSSPVSSDNFLYPMEYMSQPETRFLAKTEEPDSDICHEDIARIEEIFVCIGGDGQKCE